MNTNQRVKFAVIYLLAIAAGIVAGTRIYDVIAF